jgi:hypothetical protein
VKRHRDLSLNSHSNPQTTTASGGGGSSALVSADFKNGLYSVNGSSATVNDILDFTGTGSGLTPSSPAPFVTNGVGLTGPTGTAYIGFNNTIRDIALNSTRQFLVVYTLKLNQAGTGQSVDGSLAIENASFTKAFGSGSHSLSPSNQNVHADGDTSTSVAVDPPTAICKIATRVNLDTGTDVSLNGGSVISNSGSFNSGNPAEIYLLGDTQSDNSWAFEKVEFLNDTGQDLTTLSV